MKILLLYPEFPNTFWSFKHALSFISKRAVTPPLGLLTVAALLPGDWQVRLVDLNVARLRSRDLAWADYAFVSAMAMQQDSAREVIGRCKAAGLKVVVGGPLFRTQADAFPEVDHMVLNEAELTLPRFLADLRAGRPQRKYTAEGYAEMGLSPVPEVVRLPPRVTMPEMVGVNVLKVKARSAEVVMPPEKVAPPAPPSRRLSQQSLTSVPKLPNCALPPMPGPSSSSCATLVIPKSAASA